MASSPHSAVNPFTSAMLGSRSRLRSADATVASSPLMAAGRTPPVLLLPPSLTIVYEGCVVVIATIGRAGAMVRSSASKLCTDVEILCATAGTPDCGAAIMVVGVLIHVLVGKQRFPTESRLYSMANMKLSSLMTIKKNRDGRIEVRDRLQAAPSPPRHAPVEPPREPSCHSHRSG